MTRLIVILTVSLVFFCDVSSAYFPTSPQPTFTDTPSRSSTLSAKKTSKGATLQWEVQPVSEVKQINIQLSDDGNTFSSIQTVKPQVNTMQHDWSAARLAGYYRLEILWKNGATSYTGATMLASSNQNAFITLLTNPVANILRLKILDNVPQNFSAEWRNAQGTLVETQTFKITAGINNIQLEPPAQVTPGTYYLRIMSDDKKLRQLFRVIKQ